MLRGEMWSPPAQAELSMQFFPGIFYSLVKYCFLSMIAKQSMVANGIFFALRTSVRVLSVLILSSSRLSLGFVCWLVFHYFDLFLMCMYVLPVYLFVYHMCACGAQGGQKKCVG